MSTVCDAVTDLIPLCRDKSASAGTRQFVENHLQSCPSCRKYYKEYVRLTKTPRACDNITVTVDTAKDFADLARRIRKRRNTFYVGALYFLGGAAFASIKMMQALHGTDSAKE